MKWKHWVSWVLLLLMVFSVTGCEKKPVYDTSPEFNPETDYQYDLMGTFSHNLTESPDGYYYLNSERYLHFIDKNTMQDIVVCSKPNCRHEETPTWNGDSDRKVCNAFIEVSTSKSLLYHKGNLYTVEYTADIEGMTIATRHFYLTEISLDATKRKRIHEIDVTTNSNGRGNPIVNHCIMHRDRFYYTVCYGTNDYVYLYCYDLQTKKVSLLHEGGSVQQTVATGDYLYVLIDDFEGADRSLWRYTISTSEKTIISDSQMHFYDTGMFAIEAVESDTEGQFKRWGEFYSLDGELQETVEFPPIEVPFVIAFADDDYIIIQHFDESTQSFERIWSVCDSHTMEQLARIPIPPDGFDTLFIRNDHLFVFCAFNGGVLCSAPLSSIGTDNFEWQHSQRAN